MGPLHTYSVDVTWTGAGRTGTSSYTAYSRDHEVRIGSKPPLLGSSDPAFRGDPTRYNPEELLVSALAQCHMLWFLHLASAAGRRRGRVRGPGRRHDADRGRRAGAVPRGRAAPARDRRRGAHLPTGAAITDGVLAGIHHQAHEHCFISRSVNFPVRHEPVPVRTAQSVSH